MKKSIVYLDYAATTPLIPEVADEMTRCINFDGVFGNPSSNSHKFGLEARYKIEDARKQIATAINADPYEIIWTSGATESNNLAIKGVAQSYKSKGKHIITSLIEHKAVLDTCHELELNGYEITYLEPEPQTGIIVPEQIAKVLREDTILVSLMLVNNELGTLTDIRSIGELTRKNNTIFHVDAAQAVGKVHIDLKMLNVDLMSFSAHKVYGPKGIGALFVRSHPQIHLKEQIHGGGHERGLRSGTLATHQIAAMGKAFEVANSKIEQEQLRLRDLRNQLWLGLQELTKINLNGHPSLNVANYLNVSFIGMDAEDLINEIKTIAAISNNSACNSHKGNPSHVLSAIGVSEHLALNSIRFSFGAYTTKDCIQLILDTVNNFKKNKSKFSQVIFN